MALMNNTPANSRFITARHRRNGKLQSCEPCRKSKLRCDHTVPVCSRCIRRRCEDKCQYHPNPLTKSGIRPSPKPGVQQQSLPSPAATSPATINSPSSSSKPDATYRENQGVFGVTSFSYVLSENLGRLGVSTATEPVVPEDEYSSSSVAPLRSIAPKSPEQDSRGHELLLFLRDREFVDRLVERWFDICSCGNEGIVCPRSVATEWLRGLWRAHGDGLASQKPEALQTIASVLWKNTRKAPEMDGDMSGMQWVRSTTGEGLRWGVVGIIATNIGISSVKMREWDNLVTRFKVDRLALAQRMSDIAKACLGFCLDSQPLDDTLLWLSIESNVLSSVLEASGNLKRYHQTGAVINTAVAMGLHQEPSAADKAAVPFFLQEMRRRAFATVYSTEIGLATMLGRPPRLTHRYCTAQPPLDLTEAEIMLEQPQLQAALRRLDIDGFNPRGEMNRITFHRAWLPFARRKEDILDLVFGTYSPDEIVLRAELIQKKSEAHWAELPLSIRANCEYTIFSDHSSPHPLHPHHQQHQPPLRMRPQERLQRDIFSLALGANDILLHQLLARKASLPPTNLIQAAYRTFQDALLIAQRQGAAGVCDSDRIALLAAQGLQSAAIVAVELLKQEQAHSAAAAAAAASGEEGGPGPRLLPRSQAIQQLAMFVGTLDAAARGMADGWLHMSDPGRRLIRRILDKLLAPPPPPISTTPPPPPAALPPAASLHAALEAEEKAQQGGKCPQPPPGTEAVEDAGAGMASSALQDDLAIWDDIDPLLFNGPVLGMDGDFMQWLESI